MHLIFDTETTGLPRDYNAPITAVDNWPRMTQIAWQLHDRWGDMHSHKSFLVKPQGFTIPFQSEKITGISTELAQQKGEHLTTVLQAFLEDLMKAEVVVGHNTSFDINIVGCELFREQLDNGFLQKTIADTCTEKTATLCKIAGGRGGKYKLPNLTELYTFLFNESFLEAHNATADVEATSRCFFELVRTTDIFSVADLSQEENYFSAFKTKNQEVFQAVGIPHIDLKKESDKLKLKATTLPIPKNEQKQEFHAHRSFIHLHNHSQYSILQATSSIPAMVRKAAACQMSALAITDIGNMMGVFHFVKEIQSHNGKNETKRIKPIVGCEFYVCEDRLNKTKKDNGYQMVFLAKNKKGYQNLIKMSSLSYVEGYYYVPRIDRSIVELYREDLIVLTGNLYGEISSKILNIGESQAEQALLWWKEQFADDLYIELMRHGQEDEDRVNEVLIEMADKHEIKVVATNNVYYLEADDADAHDILLCVKDSEKKETPIGKGRGYRYGLPNQAYYFKTAEEMEYLFRDIPQAIIDLQEVVDKIEVYDLSSEVLLPAFDIPETFKVQQGGEVNDKCGENEYLRHLTFEGASKRYGDITLEIEERLNFELETIKKTGYPGYFLIVQDFCQKAREMGVSVGPGRGSAAGSAVAYCIGITNVDPIAYDLLFERFLNPDRVSLPDIDIDFDDEGRQKVINYVIEKYGANQVAQIITYGTMGAKSSIRDTARVLSLSLQEADKLAKLVPNIKLNKIFSLDDKALKADLRPEEFEMVKDLKRLAQGHDLVAKTLNQARVLEGSVRNIGTHACGVIITPDDITKFVPIARAKDSELYVTQFDNAVVESAGLLKMDFLGLKTLTIIKDACRIIAKRRQIILNPDNFPLDDQPTYELFQRGETIGIFQYESAGMQKYMKELKPTVFADLIAMNALYRPGPLEYIPSFIKRKHGQEKIVYDLEACREYLEETYGITVYQEQVMLLSQKLADFTKGEADVLRKAMGKKVLSLLEKLKPKFLEGGKKNGHKQEILEKIWKDWEAFASYAFNKSHSTCYALIAYQTAYLKTHYPSEYMASVLSNNMNDIKSVSFFMEACRRMNIQVLGPDINESEYRFTVNDQGVIRFGMGAVKGVGEGAVRSIVAQREENGLYVSIFDLVKRVDLRTVNKKCLENLAYAGTFDDFKQFHRAQLFYKEQEITNLEKILRFGQKYQERKASSQVSLFGETIDEAIVEPILPTCDYWRSIEKLKKEKEVVGLYITAHPLDDFKYEIKYFTQLSLDKVEAQQAALIGKELMVAGVLTQVNHKVSTNTGKEFATFTLEDYQGSYTFFMGGEDYLKYRHFLVLEQFLHLKLGFSMNRTNDRVFINVKQIQLLQNILDADTRSLTVNLNIHDMTDEFTVKLTHLMLSNPGDKNLTFVVHDDKVRIKMPSRGVKVAINRDFLDRLTAWKQIQFTVNR